MAELYTEMKGRAMPFNYAVAFLGAVFFLGAAFFFVAGFDVEAAPLDTRPDFVFVITAGLSTTAGACEESASIEVVA